MPRDPRDRWDELLVFPVVQRYLIDHKFPDGVSLSMIEDQIVEEPEISKFRIVQPDRCISRALREMGYRRTSVHGKFFTKTNLGVIVPF